MLIPAESQTIHTLSISLYYCAHVHPTKDLYRVLVVVLSFLLYFLSQDQRPALTRNTVKTQCTGYYMRKARCPEASLVSHTITINAMFCLLCTHACIHACVCVTHKNTYARAHTHIHTLTRTHTHTFMCMHEHTHACMRLRMHTHTCMHASKKQTLQQMSDSKNKGGPLDALLLDDEPLLINTSFLLLTECIILLLVHLLKTQSFQLLCQLGLFL